MAEKVKSKSPITTPKGMHDLMPNDISWYRHIIQIAEKVSEYYGFKHIETPIIEDASLFVRAIGNATDIVSKEMYTLRAGRESLALRPESTAGIVRAYFEHGLHTKPQPIMLYTHGSFFRHERPQAGRFREFRQFDLEILGEAKPIADATVMQVFYSILTDLGFKNTLLKINTLGDKDCRATYRKHLVAYYRRYTRSFTKDEKSRLTKNPLRLLDSKEEHMLEINAGAPALIDYLSSASKKYFHDVLEFLDASEVSYELDDHLVRGLDYYTHTVFEIFVGGKSGNETEEKNRETIKHLAVGGGGRYDDLSILIGRHDVPAVGAAFGVDRIVKLMREQKLRLSKEKIPRIFFIHLGPRASYKSLSVMETLRKAKIPVKQSIGKDNLRDQLTVALKLGMDYAVILGQKEALENSIIIQDLKTRSQTTVPIESLVKTLKDKL